MAYQPQRSGFGLAATDMRLPLPCFMLVTDRKLAGGDDAQVQVVAAAVEGGVNAVQLREKDLPPDHLLPLARRLRDVTHGRALLLVNGPLKVALACEADGVHLPEGAPSIERPARPILVGRSVHSVDAAECASAECADYLIVGPIFETGSHPGRAPSGPTLIEAITLRVAVPVLAIGGVTSERVAEVVGATASGIVVISAILGSPTSLEATRRLREALDAAQTKSAVQ